MTLLNSLENSTAFPTHARSENPSIFTNLNLLIVLLLALSWVSYLYWDAFAIDELQRKFAGGIHPLFDDFLALVKGFGKGETNLLIAVVSVLAGYRRLAFQIVIALIISAVLVWPLKVSVQRERPRGNSLVSFPSGDAASSAAMALPIVEAFPPAIPLVAALVASIAIGRVAVQAHYPSDVIFGVAIGLIAGALSIRICSRFRDHPESRIITRIALFIAGGFCFLGMTGLAGEQVTRTLILCGPALLLLLILQRLDQAESKFRKYGSSRWLPYLLAGVITLLYLYTASASTLWDRDEPRYARAAIEMMRSGSFMVPTFNGEYRLHKPILVYWLMQPFLWLPLKTEVAVRLASVFCFAICCLVTCRLGALFRSRKTGLIAFAAMAGTPLAMINGTASTTDSLLLLCTTICFTIFYYYSIRGLRQYDMLPLGVALGAAQLTKGPVGLFTPLFSMFALAWPNSSDLRGKRSIAIVAGAVLIGTALFFAWFLPANSITNGAFYDFAFKKQVVHRTLSPMEGHGGSILFSLPYYLLVVIAGFFPWALYLPGGFYLLLSKRFLQGRDRLFLSMWIFPLFILMTVVATKLPHYILPVWPALAILAAITIEEADGPEVDPALRRWMQRGIWLFGAVGGLLSIALRPPPGFCRLKG